MKTLIVYTKDSFVKYPGLYERVVYVFGDRNVLTVYARNPSTGEETVKAVYREWTRLEIENDQKW